jgi:UDPglucose--hexose-1-phosphate uridylyltransferase
VASPELRRDPVVGRWVIIAADRGRRPSDFPRTPPVLSENEEHCPFCPGREAGTPPELAAIRGADGTWRKRVFRSLHPVIAAEEEFLKLGEGMFDMMSGYGKHEVVVESPAHESSYATMTIEELTELALLWRERILVLRLMDHVRSVTLFGNRGVGSGATIAHPHSQLIATPAAPRRLTEEIATCYAYFQSKERCVLCDLYESESSGPRRIHENEAFLLMAPYAARFPFEMWIVPRLHASHFEEIDDAGARRLAEMMSVAFRLLERAAGDPPYSFVLHSAPSRERGMVHYHWHIEIMPRLANTAGFEWGTGFYINAMPPETAAETMRSLIAATMAAGVS